MLIIDPSRLLTGEPKPPLPSASPAIGNDPTKSQNGLDAPKTLLSILSSNPSNSSLHTPTTNTTSLDSPVPKSAGSRFFPKPLSSEAISPMTTSDHGSSSTQAPPQFNPPPGSRLLAFGARNTSGAPGLSNQNNQPSHGFTSPQTQNGPDVFQSNDPRIPAADRPAMAEAIRAQQGYSPFELQSRSSFASYDDSRDNGNFGQGSDHLRRTTAMSPPDRAPFSDNGPPFSQMGSGHGSTNSESFSVNGAGTPFDPTINGQPGAGKGSRFLKYFEEKGREGGQGQAPPTGGMRKPQGQVGYQSSSPIPGQRPEQGGFGGIQGGSDTRTVDDLFAMLNTSSQVCVLLLSSACISYLCDIPTGPERKSNKYNGWCWRSL